MGSPVSAVVANLYMESFEELALETGEEEIAAWMSLSIGSPRIQTGISIHFESHHPTHVKSGLVRFLHDKSRGIISTQENLQKLTT